MKDEKNKAAEKTANREEHRVVSEGKKKRSRYQSDDRGSLESDDDSLKAIFDYFADVVRSAPSVLDSFMAPRLQLFLRSSILRFL